MTSHRITVRQLARQIQALLALAFLFVLSAPASRAQEDINSPAPPLQWPTPVSQQPNGHLPFKIGTLGLRQTIEEVADAALCKILMKDAQVPIPNESTFTYANCPSSFKSKIDSREGKVSWAEGARPMECGRNCLGPPFMSQTRNLDRPNSRYALVYGHLTFHIDLPGPINRDINYGLEIDVSCGIPPGAKQGVVHVTTHTDGPWADDPGILESIVNFLVLPLELSQRIDDGVNSTYLVSSSTGPPQGPCSSMGAGAQPPDFFQGDEFIWDIPKHPGHPNAADLVKSTATLYFDHIIRKHTIETSPSTAPLTFTLYINGVPAHIPRNGSITLSPKGESHDQKYCKTVTMDGADSLQILFVDSLGGAVWSQFTPDRNFGSTGVHKMTTGRTYLRPGLHAGDKPLSFLLREFELDYRIDYRGAPTSVISVPAPSRGHGRHRQIVPNTNVGASTGGRPVPDSACTII